MSFADRAILWLHILAVIFTIGPGTVAIMATPRYIRKRNLVVLGYLYRVTRIYAVGSLLALIFGLVLAQLLDVFSKPWISVSITLYVVAAVLLVLIVRDQRRAISALAVAEGQADATVRSEDPQKGTESEGAAAGGDQPGTTGTQPTAPQPTASQLTATQPTRAQEPRIAAVERGRIASMSGVIGLIWMVVLVLMVWNSH
jgi:Ca2+/Na+ antiporter